MGSTEWRLRVALSDLSDDMLDELDQALEGELAEVKARIAGGLETGADAVKSSIREMNIGSERLAIKTEWLRRGGKPK
jgi:hypothetical protein